MTQETRVSKATVFYYLCFIFVLPIFLLYFNIVHTSWRVVVLLFCSILIYGIVHKAKWSREELGLQVKNRKKQILPYILFTILGVLFVITLAQFTGNHVMSQWWRSPHFWLIFIFVSYFQEFAYRVFLIPELFKIFPDTVGVVLIDALLFTLLHIIYPVPFVALPLAFISGIAFSLMYIKFKDFWLIGLAHSVLNFVAVLFGFFVIH